MKQQTEVAVSQPSQASDGLRAAGRLPGRCGRQVLIDTRVRESRVGARAGTGLTHADGTSQHQPGETHTLLGLDQHLNCLTLSVHMFSTRLALVDIQTTHTCVCVCCVCMRAYMKHGVKCFMCVSV